MGFLNRLTIDGEPSNVKEYTAGTNITITPDGVISATGGSGGLPSGGTTGQALVKKSNATGDVEWKNVGGSITVDDALSTTSENPVQNKVITNALNGIESNITNITNNLGDKQDKLTAGANIQITGNVISATDTKYTAGTNITIDSNNVISSTGGGSVTVDDALSTTSTNPVENRVVTNALNAVDARITNIEGDISSIEGDITNITNQITDIGVNKQDKLTAGNNITIDTNNVISAVDTTYVAGTGITITGNVISSSGGGKDNAFFIDSGGYISIDYSKVEVA